MDMTAACDGKLFSIFLVLVKSNGMVINLFQAEVCSKGETLLYATAFVHNIQGWGGRYPDVTRHNATS